MNTKLKKFVIQLMIDYKIFVTILGRPHLETSPPRAFHLLILPYIM